MKGFRRIDAPIKQVVIDGAVWLIDAIQGNYWSHKGPDLEHLKPQICHKQFPVSIGNGENIMIGGAWFDPTAKRLYAVIHSERYHLVKRGLPRGSPSPGWCRKKTALAISDDMGQTWQNAGDILTAPDEGEEYDWLRYSGNEFEAGPADFDLYVDERGGYFYITSWNSYVPKNGGLNGFHMFTEVARCAITDRMAPGKWFKYRDGTWTEPGLGGRASRVRFDRRGIYGGTIYSSYLKKYLRIGTRFGWWMNDAWAYESLWALADVLGDVDPKAAAEYAAECENYKKDILKVLNECIALSPVIKVRDGAYRSFHPTCLDVRGPLSRSVPPSREEARRGTLR